MSVVVIASAITACVARPVGVDGAPWAGDAGAATIQGPSAHSLVLTAGLPAAGDGGYCEVPTAAALEPTAAVTWIMRATSFDPSGYNGVNAILFSQWDTAAAKGRLLIYRNSTDDTQIVVGHSNTGGDVISCTVYSATGAWTEGVEHEVAFVFDGSGVGNAARAKLYIDGALAVEDHFGTWPAALSAPSAPTNFGHRKGSAAMRPWSGYIRDVRVYSSALSAAQIAAAYTNPDDAALPALTARWRFGETSGNFVASPGGFVATPTATGAGRAPSRAIVGWLGGNPSDGVSILPIGDSYTTGFGYTNNSTGWRAEFRNRLHAVHKRRFNIVGPYTDASPPAWFSDTQHAGVSGRKVDTTGSADMNGDAPGWIATYAPDVIVILGGYNDIAADGVSGAVCRDRIETLARTCNTARAATRIVIATIPRPNNANATAVDDCNALLPALVTTLLGDGIPASLADVRAATSVADLIPTDNVHPGNPGYERMGVVLADAVHVALGGSL